ncbi:MAG: leucine-rich repeat domain-containing protein, partial [Treponema sp.]|nr:leucine-rich repeat domain-containing protein [Treponema sp.]
RSENVAFIFVNQTVTINGIGRIGECTCEEWGDTCTCEYWDGACFCADWALTSQSFNITLTQGWNALHIITYGIEIEIEIEIEYDSYSFFVPTTMSVHHANPGSPVRWIFHDWRYGHGFVLNPAGTGYIITGLRGGWETDIVIPSTHNGLPVVAIGDWAFSGNQLTTVTIPNSVTSIGDGAFSGNQLTTVTIPNSVTNIGDRAFARNQLTSVVIPNSVTSIGGRAFDDNWQLAAIHVAPGNANFSSINGVLYSNNATVLIRWPKGKSGIVTIPDSVTNIGDGAFQDNQLTSITIPNSVTSIGNSAFQNNQLTSVIIPNSVTSIGDFAFASNWSMISVTIGNSVTSIGEAAFAENRLTTVSIPNSVTSIGWSAFANNQLTSVVIPNSVTSIGNGAFVNNQLTSITIPNSVTSIGNGAFQNNQLTTVTIPNSVTNIGYGVFAWNQLTSITIGSGVNISELGWIPAAMGTHGDSFLELYNGNGRLAGTYTWSPTPAPGVWTRQP